MVDLTQLGLRSPILTVPTSLLLVSFFFCLFSVIVFQKKKKNNNNYDGVCVDLFDTPVEGVSTNERFKKTRYAKNVHERYMEDGESYCSDGSASDFDIDYDDSEVEAKADDFINRFKEQLKQERLNEILKNKQTLKDDRSGDDDGDHDDNNDDGDSGNNNGGGGQNSKKGNGSDGDSNGHGNDKYERGGGWSEMDLMGKPGFDYKYTYHAPSEFQYPVEQLQKTHNEIVTFEGLRDVSVDNFQEKRLERTRNAYNQHDKESNYNNGGDGNMTPRFFHTGFHGAQLEHCKKFYEPKYLSCVSCH